MAQGLLDLIPAARVGHIGLYRDSKSLQSVEYYFKAPPHLAERYCLVVDPMLATGSSAITALNRIKKAGARDIVFLCLLAAPEGFHALRAAKENSYSPYSGFPVGAAVLLEDGQIFTGANIENTSYGLTCCAERVALFSARTATAAKITGLAISIGPKGQDLPKTSLVPCGACRQVMAEFLDPQTPVYVDGNRTFTMDEILPHAFKLK